MLKVKMTPTLLLILEPLLIFLATTTDTDILDVDPCVAMLHNEISNGSLPKEHIFRKCVSNVLSFAQNTGNPRAQFSWDPTVGASHKL